jgi:hypothetical protein
VRPEREFDRAMHRLSKLTSLSWKVGTTARKTTEISRHRTGTSARPASRNAFLRAVREWDHPITYLEGAMAGSFGPTISGLASQN